MLLFMYLHNLHDTRDAFVLAAVAIYLHIIRHFERETYYMYVFNH